MMNVSVHDLCCGRSGSKIIASKRRTVMQMLVSGQKIDIDAVELRTVKVIAGRFLNSFKEI